MGPRVGRWAAGALVLAALLLAGHALATALADHWWEAATAPRAVPFLTRWALVHAILEITGVAVGTGWFVGHLLLVLRSVGSVELPRRVGDLEIRESVSAGRVAAVAIAVGVLVGALVGAGGGRTTGAVLLAWHGLRFDLADPVLHLDAATYVAHLPLWLSANHFAAILILGGLGLVGASYGLVGALRIGRRGVALTDQARTHLGLLLCAALVLLAGSTLLAPLRAVARLDPGALPTGFEVDSTLTLALITLVGAALVGWWALRGGTPRLVAGLVTALLVSAVRLALPAIGPPPASDPARREFTALAWGLGALQDRSPLAGGMDSGPPSAAGAWSAASLLPPATPTGTVISATRESVEGGGRPHRAWVTLSSGPGDSSTVALLADDQVNSAGGLLSFRPGDSLSYPGVASYLILPPTAVRPGAPRWRLGRTGIPVAGAFRRLTLAWAAQAGPLLGATVPDSAHLAWRLDPVERLGHLLPPARWGTPRLVLSTGNPAWVVPGFLPYAAFPVARRATGFGDGASGADPGLIGLIDATSGATRIFLRPGAGPVATAWEAITLGLIEPAADLPADLAATLSYPAEWLAVQAKVMAGTALDLPPLDVDSGDLIRPVGVWDGGDPRPQVAFVDRAPPGRVRALLQGTTRDGRLIPVLTRIPRSASLPDPSRLARSWHAFPAYAALADSVRAGGSELRTGPVLYQWRGGRLLASQATYRVPAHGPPALIWASVASDRRLGGGPTPAAAWANLNGGPIPPGARVDRLAEARVWVARADSALRRGDVAAFSRAFAAVKALVESP